jgi:hypothetical protein
MRLALGAGLVAIGVAGWAVVTAPKPDAGPVPSKPVSGTTMSFAPSNLVNCTTNLNIVCNQPVIGKGTPQPGVPGN